MIALSRDRCLYVPYYCEENIWHLAQVDELAGCEREVVFVSNESRSVALWGQRAAAAADEPVIWDYHVILSVDRDGARWIFDLDTLGSFPSRLDAYAERTFRPVPARFRPSFRAVRAEVFFTRFRSDRRHMRDEGGVWRAPPPPWPPISEGSNVLAFADPGATDVPGEVLDLDRWLSRAGGS